MYDTLEIPLKPGAPFTDRIRSIKNAVEFVRDPLSSEIPFRSNLYYNQVVDLRNVEEIDAVLHLNAKRTGTHKIQIIEAGKKCYGEIAETLSLILEEHPELQGVSRVDSCVDVVDGPEVRWMAQSVRARSAQWQAQFGNMKLTDGDNKTVPYSDMGKREVKTMYLGMRPNCFRIYDKRYERFHAWTIEKRRHERLASQIVLNKALESAPPDNGVKAAISSGGKKTRDFYARKVVCSGRQYFPFPDFESWFLEQCRGPQSNMITMPKTLTRVERQMAAGRVPDPLNSIEKIFSKEALDFNPFGRLEFSGSDSTRQFHSPTKLFGTLTSDVPRDGFSPVEYAAGILFQHWLESGVATYQQVFTFWNEKRHGKRIAQKFAPFVSAAGSVQKLISLTPEDLYDRYRDSLKRQMAA